MILTLGTRNEGVYLTLHPPSTDLNYDWGKSPVPLHPFKLVNRLDTAHFRKCVRNSMQIADTEVNEIIKHFSTM